MNLGSFVEIQERSRYLTSSSTRYKFPKHLFDGTFTFLPSKRVYIIPETTRDLYHEVSSGERGKLDIIAYRYYGNVRFWWVIAQANRVINPLRLEPGTQLRIPPIDVVYEAVK